MILGITDSVSKSNDWITWGLEERNDVWGAVNFISNLLIIRIPSVY